MYSPYQMFLLGNPNIHLIGLVSKMRGKMDSKIDSILNLLSRLELSPALVELVTQRLNRVHDIQVLNRLIYEIFRLSNEQDVHKWLDKYLPHGEKENKIESILETLHTRVNPRDYILELIAQALIRIDDVQVLEHLELEALRTSDIESNQKFRVLLRQDLSPITDSDEQSITNLPSWTHFAINVLDKHFSESDEENIYQ